MIIRLTLAGVIIYFIACRFKYVTGFGVIFLFLLLLLLLLLAVVVIVVVVGGVVAV
jgi:hypothetical protein